MKSIFLFSIMLLATSFCFAQTVSNSTVASAGATATLPTGTTVTYTIAQPNGITTVSNGTTTLTQGFLQTDNFSLKTSTVTAPNMELIIYPNPSLGKFEVKFKFESKGMLSFTMLDINGKSVSTTTINDVEQTGLQQLDYSNLAAGEYLLLLNFKASTGVSQNGTFKVHIVK